MIHMYSLMGHYIVLDIPSGAVHQFDREAYELLLKLKPPLPPLKEAPVWLNQDELEIYSELLELQEEGLLFSPEITTVFTGENTPLKAACLHVAHDCNLRCGYCFAGTGDFGKKRALMSPGVGERSIDYILKRCGNRNNLEIDFFGGEPLMAFETIKHTVEYAKTKGKNFRFTMTTNGLNLDEEKSEWINSEMDNIVLSLDGRKEVNDKMRRTISNSGSYEIIVPKYKRLIAGRKKDYFIRGTYTSNNLDFISDINHIASEGFKNISVEPVVLSKDNELSIKEEHLPGIFAQYELLTQQMIAGADFSFFHFNVDLEQGPCIYKRLRGCGAGYEYAAITPEGDVYPCHQFVGRDEYKMGNVLEDTFSSDISKQFAALNIDTRPDCKECWARYYCSGGCSAANLTTEGDIKISDTIGCKLERKRLECAILLNVVQNEKTE